MQELIGVRLSPEILIEIRRIAAERFEGNVSMAIRFLLSEGLDRDFLREWRRKEDAETARQQFEAEDRKLRGDGK